MYVYELLLVATLILPPSILFWLGRKLERGLDELDAEARAERGYLLSKITSGVSLAQMLAIPLLCLIFGEQMTLLHAPANAMFDVLAGIARATTPWFATVLSMVLLFTLLGTNLVLLMLPAMRLSRRILNLAEGAAKAQRRMSLRATLVSLLPMLVWFGIFFALPMEVTDSPSALPLILAAFLAITYAVAPLQVVLQYPTERMADDHPVTVMAHALCRQAGVRACNVYQLKFGELKVANAMVSGLLPWYRRIYVSDTMLETFTLDEIRAVLAHEVGHVKHRHLLGYLAFALAALPLRELSRTPLTAWAGEDWGALIALALMLAYWSIAFTYASRHFERQADRYALDATGDVQTLQAALDKLATANGVVKKYSKWDIFNTHPAVSERIRAIS